jgi:hypothetical protein
MTFVWYDGRIHVRIERKYLIVGFIVAFCFMFEIAAHAKGVSHNITASFSTRANLRATPAESLISPTV